MRTILITALGLLSLAGAPAAGAAERDANHDRLPDRWERHYHLSLKVDQSRRDTDRDGLNNLGEYRAHTNPRKRDTDGDGVGDAREVRRAAERPAAPAPADEPAPETGDAPAPAGGDDEPAGGDATPEQPAATALIVSYTQGAGFGGLLVIQRPNGERVTSFFGEKTDLECGDAPCTKDHLVAGAPVAVAEHGRNPYGNDVWTRVVLGAGS
jgi:hypothetical protein